MVVGSALQPGGNTNNEEEGEEKNGVKENEKEKGLIRGENNKKHTRTVLLATLPLHALKFESAV
ncbi:hypothetical protein E2C01_071018 [Portunus trituberculatus]|uniref:Uncharacterized protein n=1 Tax=Portunus trituberculatus TaxID=210409 RepID=A0A5B7HUA5_PORTR|nr:hypothetical protein [Portunus trituberculatus]